MTIFGHSRGGLASLALAATEARVLAVVSLAAPVNLAQYVRDLSAFAPSAGTAVVQFLGGLPAEVPELYAMFEVERLASLIRQPIMLIHGTADMRVPVEYPQALELALRKAGNRRVQLELVPGMGHSLELGTAGYQFHRVIALATSWLNDQLG